MVGNLEGTVGNVEETVAFIEATNFLKKEKGVKFGDIGDLLGLNRGQLNMTRIKRRYITKQEIGKLLQHYPEAARFFKAPDTTEEHATTQTLNEPMGTHFYGKQIRPEPWEELAETQRKLIARLEAELVEVKGKLREMEGQNKALIEIVSQRK